jgi:hypothetical protein
MKEDGDDAVVGTRFGSSVGVLGPVVDSNVINVGWNVVNVLENSKK